jgi:hypothetical protein
VGSQKVPGMVVLHCNGRTYGNDYPITFTVRPLRAYTLAPSVLPLLEHRRKASVRIFGSSDVAFHLMSSVVGKLVPLGPILRVGNSGI